MKGDEPMNDWSTDEICEDMGINLYSFFSYQVDDDLIICENENEKELVRAYRKLGQDQIIRLTAYLTALLDEESFKK